MPDRYEDPATSRLPHVRYDDPAHNPIAFLPADQPEGRVTYGGEVDYFDPSRRDAFAAVQAAAPNPWIYGPGEDDDLVELTDNGLRPDDLALEQPPQDPEWRP